MTERNATAKQQQSNSNSRGHRQRQGQRQRPIAQMIQNDSAAKLERKCDAD
jgi:hypothetical protein